MGKLFILKDVKMGGGVDIIKSLSFRVMNEKSKFIDEEIRVVLNQKPPKMKEENWHKMIRKVLKIEYRPT